MASKIRTGDFVYRPAGVAHLNDYPGVKIAPGQLVNQAGNQPSGQPKTATPKK